MRISNKGHLLKTTYLPINDTGRYNHPYVKDLQPFGCSCGNDRLLSMAAMCIWGREYMSSGVLLDGSLVEGGQVIEGIDEEAAGVVTSRIMAG